MSEENSCENCGNPNTKKDIFACGNCKRGKTTISDGIDNWQPKPVADKPDEYEKAMQEAKVSLEVDVKIGGHYADVGNRINTVEQLALAKGRKQMKAEIKKLIESQLTSGWIEVDYEYLEEEINRL